MGVGCGGLPRSRAEYLASILQIVNLGNETRCVLVVHNAILTTCLSLDERIHTGLSLSVLGYFHGF